MILIRLGQILSLIGRVKFTSLFTLRCNCERVGIPHNLVVRSQFHSLGIEIVMVSPFSLYGIVQYHHSQAIVSS